ncbi:MAG: ATP phosphoribosyltransferase [Sphingomonadales bacterium]|nr:ATP phosphoribosyltransferase [Sphingomonadales bacterium]
MAASKPIYLALPKGRILQEVLPLLEGAGIVPEADFFSEKNRKLTFATNDPGLTIIRVRSFDVATFVAFGAADMGIAGNDVLQEFDYSEIYAPIDLGIGACRLCLAEPEALKETDDPSRWSHIRIATKYPNTARRHFAAKGIQAECIRLSGAIELAPSLGLAERIVDLVSTGSTLKANGLVEVETLSEVTSRLIVNRAAFKTRPHDVGGWVGRFEEAVRDAA